MMGHPPLPGAASLETGSSSLRNFSAPAAEPALIHPRREAGERLVTAAVIMTFTQPDFRHLGALLRHRRQVGRIFGCALHEGTSGGVPLTVAAPAPGAPLAAMVLEKLIALGAKQILALGWCGSLTPKAPIGTIILPERAVAGDGTSPHYHAPPSGALPDPGLWGRLKGGLQAQEIPWLVGPVCSIDAFFRETPTLVRDCQSRGILALDLEFAALLAVGRFRGVAVAGLLVVSDELFDGTWRPARGSPAFRLARRQALELILHVAREAAGDG